MNDNASSSEDTMIFTPKPSLSPPPNTTGIVGWMRFNLFDGFFNSILTVISFIILALIAINLYDWAITRAIWEASSRDECRVSPSEFGTCWAGVKFWFKMFIYGRYPDDQFWRVNSAFAILIIWVLPLWLSRVTLKPVLGLTAVIIFPFMASYIFLGGERNLFMSFMLTFSLLCFFLTMMHSISCLFFGRSLASVLVTLTGFKTKNERLHKFPIILIVGVLFAVIYYLTDDYSFKLTPNNLWGGLFLTLVISGIGIASALPTGIILALGRRSKMTVIRVLCVAFIELFRSVPLITILFMATTMFPLFLPEGMAINKLASAIVAVCLFAAAYMAETVRGGLQSIPKGQFEAAEAVGLSYWQSMCLIIMPQALKFMIPNIVGNFIGLFKDTTLVSIIGLYDLLGMINAVAQDPKWIGLHHEPLFCATILFFIGCFMMSKYSQYLERRLGAGDRR